jgi:hypothetical protein
MRSIMGIFFYAIRCTVKEIANLKISTFAVCLMVTGLIACGRSTPSADNLDGVDPPEINPHPMRVFTIHVLAPASLNVSLYENYSAPSGQGFGSVFGPGLCSKDPTKPVPPGHSMKVPIHLTGSNGDYIGSFMADRFSPGRCEWGFFGISSNFKEDTPVLYSSGPPIPAYPHGPEQVADIWCGDNPIPTEPLKFICTDFTVFAKYTKGLPESLLAAHPHIVSRGPESIISMDDTTKSIVLRYHDLAAEAGAARSADATTKR